MCVCVCVCRCLTYWQALYALRPLRRDVLAAADALLRKLAMTTTASTSAVGDTTSEHTSTPVLASQSNETTASPASALKELRAKQVLIGNVCARV
jgi:hypothetical protein